VEVLASRPGYLTAIVSSPATVAVAPGVIHNLRVPEITGKAIAGHTLKASTGSWSITPDTVTYTWYAGGHVIKGAHASTYLVTPSVAGYHLHVVTKAVSAGYTSARAESDRTDRVVMGTIAFERPTIAGRALVGRTLTAKTAGLDPQDATLHYHWYRGGVRIQHADEQTYVVRPADVGHRLHVVVGAHAENWVSRTRRSAAAEQVRTTPTLDVRPSIRNGRVLLEVDVTAPGLRSPDGHVHAWRGDRLVGRFAVTDGHGSRLLQHIVHGTHRLTVVYRGDQQTKVVTTVTVTVP
jgi:hypothetical protein